MDRTSDITKATDLFGSGKHGFTEGEPGVTPRTIIRDTDLNSYQEEIVGAIEAAGLTPDPDDLGQLAKVCVPLCANYEISGTAVSNATKLSLTDGGPAAQDADSDAGFVLASDVVTLPSNGLYLVHITAHLTSSDTSNPTKVGISMDINGENYFFMTRRFSATTSDPVQVSGTILLDINNTAIEKILLNPYTLSGSTSVIGDGTFTMNRLVIQRLRAHD